MQNVLSIQITVQNERISDLLFKLLGLWKQWFLDWMVARLGLRTHELANHSEHIFTLINNDKF